MPAAPTSVLNETRIRSRVIDRLRIGRVRGSVDLRLDGDTHWPYCALYIRAGAVTLPEEAVELTAHSLTVIRPQAGTRLVTGPDADVLVIRIPATAAAASANSLAAACGGSWSSERGTASLVGHVLEALAAEPDDYRPSDPGRLAQYIVGLIALMCADSAPAAAGSRAALLDGAKKYIDEHLADLDLTPDRIAAATNVSTRTLHRLFGAEGMTLGSWIRARRLERCRSELVAPVDSTPVSSIGARWGLWDAAHFSRTFKAEFGLSPRAYREVHRRHLCDEGCLDLAASA